jgi:hypothetical protein
MEAAETPISREDWEAWVNAAADMSFDESATYTYEKQSSAERTEIAAMWSGHPDGEAIAFWYAEGEVRTKTPDEPTVRRMFEIALDLSARVQGDDGEFYGPNGEPTE